MPLPTPAGRAVLSGGVPANALIDPLGQPILDEAGRYILVS